MLTLDQLDERLRTVAPNTNAAFTILEEFDRRQAVSQIRAAEATERMAQATERNSRYILWSVIAVGILAGLNLLTAFLAYLK
jgi:hypothetical protein